MVRITSDCPLIDSTLIDKIITYTIDHDLDYWFQIHWPALSRHGEDIAGSKLTFESAGTSMERSKSLNPKSRTCDTHIWNPNSSCRRRGTLRKSNNHAWNPIILNLEHIRLTGRMSQSQFDCASRHHDLPREENPSSWKQYVDLIEENPPWLKSTSQFTKNEGYQKIKLWKKKNKKSRYQNLRNF